MRGLKRLLLASLIAVAAMPSVAVAQSKTEFLLHTANPTHWPTATLRDAMYTHLDQTLNEATHRLQGNYAADVKDYDMIVTHILAMADISSNGIIAQFPQKFELKGDLQR